MRVGLIQLSVGDDPAVNLPVTQGLIAQAAVEGAELVLTPEATNCLSSDRAHQAAILRHEDDDPTLAALCRQAAELGIWLLVGSLALKAQDTAQGDAPFVNRSFLIGPDGAINARYDKIHMFDVQISETETYRESSAYRPGNRAVMANTPFGGIGMTICYDVRFPHLYRRLAQAGARILTVPAAFNDTTGAAHWEILLRARAIECGAFVLAPAQCGLHADRTGRNRRSHGHSMAVGPWGEVLLDAGTDIGVSVIDLDLQAVDRARARVPALFHDRDFEGP
ncbi:putative amidohydrolase [Albidovulum inexpectatum]|uniref:Putative amidohydrolase n=1 Tax=Albidovulum inexpectatum TaxID=196587 RepID=A0A2S5JMB0_9RHOB|nr:carbon-nitrogen hydrolase family protein [Albidovulum inexpectatum]PPB82624.1 putative amidohydrolase [Albidovulum inexpectatum]